MAAQPDRLTERARDALHHAERKARALNHGAVGQEHLLLGLLNAEDGLAVALLATLMAEPDAIRAAATAMVPRQIVPSPRVLTYTPQLQKALELAADEAEGFGHGAVGTDHLLLGMLREGTGVGADILTGLGITLNAARNATLHLHAAERSEP